MNDLFTKEKYWNDLFENRTTNIPYDRFLQNDIKYLKPGKLLEIGAGEGRNTQLFLDKGFDITSIDFSSIGIEKMKQRYSNNKLEILLIDLNNDFYKLQDFVYDSVVIIHSFLSFEIFKKLWKMLNTDGTIYINTFLKESVEMNSSKYTVSISESEINEIEELGKILFKEQIQQENGTIMRLVLSTVSSA
jgi:cyclopropane fatty-acyl-phospholipid synthase-like methyltransferase